MKPQNMNLIGSSAKYWKNMPLNIVANVENPKATKPKKLVALGFYPCLLCR